MVGEEYYIEDDDLIELLKDVLGDKITDEDIEKILAASEDDKISEEDFDNIVEEILSNSKSDNLLETPEPIVESKINKEKEFIYLSASPNKCPVCGASLLDGYYCPICNLKFSFTYNNDENLHKK